MDRATVQGWERGLASPGIKVIPRVIDFLGYDPLPVPGNISDRIAYARRRMGFTQEDLAQALSVGSVQIWEWSLAGDFPRLRPWLESNQCSMSQSLLSNYFDEHTFAPATVELAVEDLLPWTKV